MYASAIFKASSKQVGVFCLRMYLTSLCKKETEMDYSLLMYGKTRELVYTQYLTNRIVQLVPSKLPGRLKLLSREKLTEV